MIDPQMTNYYSWEQYRIDDNCISFIRLSNASGQIHRRYENMIRTFIRRNPKMLPRIKAQAMLRQRGSEPHGKKNPGD